MKPSLEQMQAFRSQAIEYAHGITNQYPSWKDAVDLKFAELAAQWGASQAQQEPCADYRAMYLKVRDELAALQQAQQTTEPLGFQIRRWLLDEAAKRIESQAAKIERLQDYDTRLSAVMPADFKDWHENSKNEWPELAAWVITNLREREAEAHSEIERLTACLKRANDNHEHFEREWYLRGFAHRQGQVPFYDRSTRSSAGAGA